MYELESEVGERSSQLTITTAKWFIRVEWFDARFCKETTLKIFTTKTIRRVAQRQSTILSARKLLLSGRIEFFRSLLAHCWIIEKIYSSATLIRDPIRIKFSNRHFWRLAESGQFINLIIPQTWGLYLRVAEISWQRSAKSLKWRPFTLWTPMLESLSPFWSLERWKVTLGLTFLADFFGIARPLRDLKAARASSKSRRNHQRNADNVV